MSCSNCRDIILPFLVHKWGFSKFQYLYYDIYFSCVLSVFAFIIAAGTLIDACRAYFAEENEKVESSVSNTSPTGKYTVSDDTKYIPSAFYGISNEKHGPSSGGGLSSTPIDGYDFSSPGNNVTSFITADNNIPNGEVTTIKAEMEIGLPAGMLVHDYYLRKINHFQGRHLCRNEYIMYPSYWIHTN